MDIVRVFYNFRFSSRKSQSQQNLAKRSVILQYGFTQNTSLIFWTPSHLILIIKCSRNIIKNLSHFTNFPANEFLCVSGKKNLHLTISLHPRAAFFKHFESKCLYISVYLLKKMFFQRRSKILAGGMRGGWRLSNLLKAACFLDLVKCFKIFHFNWNFWKFNNFSAFRYFHLQHWKAEISQTIWTTRVILWLKWLSLHVLYGEKVT